MESHFDNQVKQLYEKSKEIVNTTDMLKSNRAGEKWEPAWPQDFKRDFFNLVDQVSLSLMQENDDFYGYFLIQMAREIRVDMSSPTGVNFKGARYVIYFNPIIFLTLTLKQMESAIKHEIFHIISMHLTRTKALKGRYSTLAINMAMDVVVNQFLEYLPPYATTLESVNLHYNLKLKPYETFEYYVEKLQTEFDLQEEDEEGEENDANESEDLKTAYNPEKTHDMWGESDEIEEQTIKEFTEKFINNALKGKIPAYLEDMITALKHSKEELPWNLYLNRLMGTVESNKKKVITRRSRRQPERLDLRGNLRSHKAEIAVAIDISGSISDEEFKQAIKEVLHIVKNYNHEITIIECDNQVRRAYKVRSIKDIQDRIAVGGGTQFTPVFEYANKKKINLLIYFTDGKGEDKLKVLPRGYKVLWVISGRGDELSLKEPYGIVKKLKKMNKKDIEIEMSDVRSDGYSMNNQAPTI
ncbi:VWA-like domain-containing protein [Cellulosilyticum sp. ST5]|uniref:vWA domain-containing protein n=1 Tax=Cellulosilyticum sp. ST5 TaxID=3055805 RepID=UPI0039774595